jgi:hypothetical protein
MAGPAAGSTQSRMTHRVGLSLLITALRKDRSITSSALACNVWGTVRPRAFAVFRLIASSYLASACTGRSPVSHP